MKVYRQVPEDAEYREYYDSYRITVDNLNDTDFLYKSMLSNGQVFFSNDEVYGFVNNQAAVRGRNLVITSEYIDNFVIRDFKVFTRATNDLLDININCNLYDYRDGKPHYLYIVLSHRGKYEVHDDMFQSDETKIVFARFIIDTLGNTRQFYMMLPFAGSADYIKGNQFYQVTDGLRVEVVNNTTKQLSLSNAKIRFSGINFDDVSSPDCLEVEFNGESVPIRYCTWDNTDKVPRVDWLSNTRDSLDSTRIMNYTSGNISTVPEGKFSIQKLYYDIYEKCIVSLYGNRVYDDMTSAILSIDTVMSYPLPDGIEYLIPIAAIINENSNDPISEENFRIINLDYNEKEILDSDTFTRQQAIEAIQKSTEALDATDNLNDALTYHTGDRNNPHRVRLDQLYNSSGNAITLADDYADYSVASILSSISTEISGDYYKKTGGTITGNVIIGEDGAARNLTVWGVSTLKGNTNIGGDTSISGSLTGTSASFSGNASIGGTLTIVGNTTSRSITPSNNGDYLGSSNKRFNLYALSINASGASTISNTLSLGGALTGTSASFSGGVSIGGDLSMGNNKRITATNGYIVIGGYSLRLGSSGGIPTQNGYGIW